jgi:hypothetical protein
MIDQLAIGDQIIAGVIIIGLIISVILILTERW